MLTSACQQIEGGRPDGYGGRWPGGGGCEAAAPTGDGALRRAGGSAEGVGGSVAAAQRGRGRGRVAEPPELI